MNAFKRKPFDENDKGFSKEPVVLVPQSLQIYKHEYKVALAIAKLFTNTASFTAKL